MIHQQINKQTNKHYIRTFYALMLCILSKCRHVVKCIDGYMLNSFQSSAFTKWCPRFCSDTQQLVNVCLCVCVCKCSEVKSLFKNSFATQRCVHNGNLTNDVINTWVTAGMLHTTPHRNKMASTNNTDLLLYSYSCSYEFWIFKWTQRQRKPQNLLDQFFSACSFPSFDSFANYYLTLHWLQFGWKWTEDERKRKKNISPE